MVSRLLKFLKQTSHVYILKTYNVLKHFKKKIKKKAHSMILFFSCINSALNVLYCALILFSLCFCVRKKG